MADSARCVKNMSTIPFHDHEFPPPSGTVQPFYETPQPSAAAITTTAPLTIDGVTYNAGTPIQNVIDALATAIAPLDDDQVVTTAPLTIGGVPYLAGTTLDVILAALVANDLWENTGVLFRPINPLVQSVKIDSVTGDLALGLTAVPTAGTEIYTRIVGTDNTITDYTSILGRKVEIFGANQMMQIKNQIGAFTTTATWGEIVTNWTALPSRFSIRLHGDGIRISGDIIDMVFAWQTDGTTILSSGCTSSGSRLINVHAGIDGGVVKLAIEFLGALSAVPTRLFADIWNVNTSVSATNTWTQSATPTQPAWVTTPPPVYNKILGSTSRLAIGTITASGPITAPSFVVPSDPVAKGGQVPFDPKLAQAIVEQPVGTYRYNETNNNALSAGILDARKLRDTVLPPELKELTPLVVEDEPVAKQEAGKKVAELVAEFDKTWADKLVAFSKKWASKLDKAGNPLPEYADAYNKAKGDFDSAKEADSDKLNATASEIYAAVTQRTVVHLSLNLVFAAMQVTIQELLGRMALLESRVAKLEGGGSGTAKA